MEGELLSPGGSMTGGAFKNSSNLLGRRREIEELEQTCERYLKQAETIQTELSLKEAIVQEKKDEAAVLKRAGQKLALEENTLRVTISRLEEKKGEIADSSSDLVREHHQLEAQAKEISESRRSLQTQKEALESESEAAAETVNAHSLLLEQAKKEKEADSERLAQLSIKQAGLAQRLDFIRENESRLLGEGELLKKELAQLSEGSTEAREAIAKKQEEILIIRREIEDSLLQTADSEALIAKKTEQKEAFLAQQKKLFTVREEISSRTSEYVPYSVPGGEAAGEAGIRGRISVVGI